MPITRATNLAGLGTIFDSLTDGGGLSVSGISTFTDLNITRVNITGVGTISNGSITNLTGTSSTITTLRSTTLNADTGNIVTGVTTNFNSTNVVITGVTTVSAGTALLPSISPSGDPNTGIFFPSADTIAFGEGGAEALRINSSGQLGVGNGNPVFLTDILSGTANTGANVNNPSQLSVTGPNKSLTAGGATVFVNSNSDFTIDTGGSIALSGRNTTSSTNSVVLGVIKGAKENATSTNTAGYLAFASANHNAGGLVEAMRIDSQQRVGIGITTVDNRCHIATSEATTQYQPVLRLETTSTGDFGPALLFEGNRNSISGTASIAIDTSASGKSSLVYTADSIHRWIGNDKTSEYLRLDASGRLLIRTSSGSGDALLAIQGRQSDTGRGGILQLQRGQAASALSVGDDIGSIRFSDNTSGNTGFAEILCASDAASGSGDFPGRLVFSTTADAASTPTERMRITSDGFFKAKGNKTSYFSSSGTWHELLSTQGNMRTLAVGTDASTVTTNEMLNLVFTAASPDNNSAAFIRCEDSTASRLFVYSDGDVVTSDAGTLTSDVTLKRDITDATPKLADVMNLQVRNFYWREDYHPNKQDKKLIGFIAQEFEQVFPGMISEHLISGGKPILDEDGNETGEKTPEVYKKGIKEGKLIPILVKALQESVARIETLEARLTAAGI